VNSQQVGQHRLLLLAVFPTAGGFLATLDRTITLGIGGGFLKKSRHVRSGRQNLNTFSGYETRRKKRRVLSRPKYGFFTDWLVPIFFLIVWVSLLRIDWNEQPINRRHRAMCLRLPVLPRMPEATFRPWCDSSAPADGLMI
jgi:hypothetical protein